MTEEEYILLTDLASIRIAGDAIRHTQPSEDDRRIKIFQLLAEWEVELYSKVHELMRDEE